MSSESSKRKVLDRANAKRRRRQAGGVFESLCMLEQDDQKFADRLLELMQYDDVLPSIVGAWVSSGNEDVRARAELVRDLLVVPTYNRRQVVTQIRHNYLTALRDKIEKAIGTEPVVLKIPLDQKGPILSSLDELLLAKLTSGSAENKYDLTEAVRHVRKIIWPESVRFSLNLLVRLQMDGEIDARIFVRLMPNEINLPQELRLAFRKLSESPQVRNITIESLSTWQPQGTADERIEQLSPRLYGLYIHGYGATKVFQRLLAQFLELMEKKRIEAVAQSIEQVLAASPLRLQATLNALGEMNRITDAQIIDLIVEKCHVKREDIVYLKVGVPQRTGRYKLQVVLKMGVIAQFNVEITAPQPDLPEFLLDDLNTNTSLSTSIYASSEQEVLESLHDQHIVVAKQASLLVSYVDEIAKSCRVLFQSGFYHSIEFKRRLAAYCLAKSSILSKKSEQESQILSRKYYLIFLTVIQRMPTEFQIYDTSVEEVFKHLLPTYLHDTLLSMSSSTEWSIEKIPATAFGQDFAFAEAFQNVYMQSPVAVARALIDVATINPSLSSSFIDSLGKDVTYGSMRDTLTYAVLLAALETEGESIIAFQVFSQLLDNSKLVSMCQAKLMGLIDLLHKFWKSKDFYDVGAKYVQISEQITELKSEVDHAIDASSHHQALALSRVLARLQQWAEERFMENSLNDPNLVSRPESDTRDTGLWAYMTKEGYARARQLLVKYERGLAEAMQLKTGGGGDSGDTYHDSFTFEEGERQERMYLKLIRDLKEKLNLARIIDANDTRPLTSVELGVTVKVRFEDSGEVEKYTLLGDFEANPSIGFISHKSPLGSAILGAKVNDVVQFKAGTKILKVKILDISRWF